MHMRWHVKLSARMHMICIRIHAHDAGIRATAQCCDWPHVSMSHPAIRIRTTPDSRSNSDQRPLRPIVLRVQL